MTVPGAGREERRKSVDLGQPDLALQDDIVDEVRADPFVTLSVCLSVFSLSLAPV